MDGIEEQRQGHSTGDITYGAGILDTLFPFLDYQGSLQVYSYTPPNLLGDTSNSAVNA